MLHLIQRANHPTNQTTHSMEKRTSQDVHHSLLKQVNAVHNLTFYFILLTSILILCPLGPKSVPTGSPIKMLGYIYFLNVHYVSNQM